MKHFLLLVITNCLLAQGIFDSESNLNEFIINSENFYEFYLGDQKDTNASVGLGSPARTINLDPPTLPALPPDPPAPPAKAGYLPFVIVNNSTVPDTEVYISIIGSQLVGTVAQTTKMYVSFDETGTGVGSYTLVAGNGSVPNFALSGGTYFFPMPQANTYAFYIPESDAGSDGISGARIYVQLKCNNTLITFTDGVLTEPSVLNQTLAPYNIAFDKFEFAYVPSGSPQVAANGTAVDFFCVPLYGFNSTPDPATSSNSGLHESQSFIMKTIIPYFFDTICTEGPILDEWNKLYSPTKSDPIRVLSLGSAMSLPTGSSFPNKFDPNYFDNKAKYGFSFLEYIWSGTTSYYKQKSLTFAIPASNLYPQPSGGVYTASINPTTNVMNFAPAFTTESQSFFPAPTTQNPNSPSASGPTSFVIASAQNLNTTFAADLQGNQVSKLFEEAVIAGLLPSAPQASGTALSNTYLTNNRANYFKNYENLPSGIGAPWYSVYSQAIHYAGNIYAFGFDEPLYPEVLMQTTTPTSSTYIGITIGVCDLVPTTCPP